MYSKSIVFCCFVFLSLTLGAQGQVFDLSTLDGANGFVINGVSNGDQSGHSVSHAGDINGDGIDDIIIGAPYADPDNINQTGASYVVFGHANGFSTPLNLANLNGINGFTVTGINDDDSSGASVSAAGDVNGDGTDDLIIGAWQAAPNGSTELGASYVVYGRTAGFPIKLNLSALW